LTVLNELALRIWGEVFVVVCGACLHFKVFVEAELDIILPPDIKTLFNMQPHVFDIGCTTKYLLPLYQKVSFGVASLISGEAYIAHACCKILPRKN